MSIAFVIFRTLHLPSCKGLCVFPSYSITRQHNSSDLIRLQAFVMQAFKQETGIYGQIKKSCGASAEKEYTRGCNAFRTLTAFLRPR